MFRMEVLRFYFCYSTPALINSKTIKLLFPSKSLQIMDIPLISCDSDNVRKNVTQVASQGIEQGPQ